MAVVDILKKGKSCLLNGIIGSACGVHGQGSNMQTPPPAPIHKYNWTQFSTPRATNICTDALIKKNHDPRARSLSLSFPLLPLVPTFYAAMPCSQEAQVVSPSKRARATEAGDMRLRFALLSEHATAPTKGSARAAGYDLYSAYDYTIPPMEKVLVKTDIQIALPSGCYGRVAPRSGLAAKHFIDVGAGVIDEDYRGNVGVVLFNFGKEKFEVKKGDRIAQLICERIFYPEIEEVQILDDTERGSGGFGSTGNN